MPKSIDRWRQYITDWQIFADLCNKVLWFSFPPRQRSKLILFDTPYAKDRGVDAEFRGELPEGTGYWVFQFKFFDTSTNPESRARQTLKRLLAGPRTKPRPEFVKAAELGADFFVVMTNIALTPDAKDRIRDAAGAYPFELLLWDRAQLDAMISERPLVEIRFFGERPFLFWREHRHQIAGESEHRKYDYRVYGRESEKKAFFEFLRGSLPIFFVSGPMGVGKTRFCLWLAETGERRFPSTTFVFPRPHVGFSVSEVARLRLGTQQTILCLDDAHNIDEIQGLVKVVTQKGYRGKVRLLITTREVLQSYVLGGIEPDQVCTCNLLPLKRKDMSEFLEKELGVEDLIPRRHLVGVSDGFPLVALLGFELLKEKKLGKAKSRREVMDAWMKRQLQDIMDNQPKAKMLRLLAAVGPVRWQERGFIDETAQFLGVKLSDVEKIVSDLVGAGYIKRAGRKIRVIPDALAEHILVSECSQNPSFLKDEILVQFGRFGAAQILTNLSRAEYESGKDLLTDFIDSVKRELPDSNIAGRKQLVEWLKALAWYRPSDTLSLVNILLKNPAPELVIKDPVFGRMTITEDVVREDLPPVLRSAAWSSYEAIPKAMRLLAQLARTEKKPDNYSDSAKSILKNDIVGYHRWRRLSHNEKAIEVLNDWIQGRQQELDLLVLKSVRGIFETMMFDTSISPEDPMSLVIEKRKISREKVRHLRTKAIDLIGRLMGAEHDRDARILALQVVAEKSHSIASSEAETLAVLECINRLVEAESEDLHVLHQSNILLHKLTKWLKGKKKWQHDALNKVRKLTEKLESNGEYEMYRWIEGLDWQDHDLDKKLRLLADQVTLSQSPDELCRKLLHFFELVGSRPPRNSGRFAWQLGNKYPEYAAELVQRASSAGNALSWILGHLMAGVFDSDTRLARTLVRQLSSSATQSDFETLVGFYSSLPEKVDILGEEDRSVLYQVARRGGTRVRELLASTLTYRTRLRENLTEDGLFDLLEVLRTDASAFIKSKVIEVLYECHQKDTSFIGRHLDFVKTLLDGLSLVSDLERDLPDNGWYYLEIVLRDVLGPEPEIVLEFFDNRVDMRASEKAGEGFRPIPFELDELFSDLSVKKRVTELFVRRTRVWALKGPLYGFEAAHLFAAVAPGVDGPAKMLLQEWIDSCEKSKLEAVAALIHNCTKTDDFWDVARRVVEKSEGDRDILSHVAAALGTTGIVMGGFTPVLEERIKRMQEWKKTSTSSAVTEFADQQIRSAQREMNWEQEREEEILDE